MKLTRFKLAFLSYALLDLLIGGHCGGLLPLGLSAAAQTTPAYGNITATSSSCLTTNCVSIQLDGATGAATIQLTGTFVATVSFEASNDNGTTWVAINGTPPNSTTAVSSATATGLWQFNVAGFTNLRARGSAYTSGTAAAVINSAHASAKASGGGAVFASGGTTANVIPKSNGSSQLADSSLTDNGTNVTSTEPIIPPASSTVPGIQSPNSSTMGLLMSGSGQIAVVDTLNGWLSVANTAAGGTQVPATGAYGFSSSTTVFAGANDTFISRKGAANVRFGAADVNGSPVAQTVSVQNAITGSDLPGSTFTIDAPLGTGLGAGAKTCLNRALMKATGTTAQTATNGFCVGESKTLSNTSATAQILANISVPSNTAGGVEGTINVNCTDGTNFDSETQSFNTSFVNKAGTVTVTAPIITATSAANNSGSCTAGITAVANGNGVDIKVTPVFGTIVPTTTTGTVMKLTVMAGGNVTIN